MENCKNTLKLDRTYSIFLIIFAGTPPTTTMDGTSLFTNALTGFTVIFVEPFHFRTPYCLVALHIL